MPQHSARISSVGCTRSGIITGRNWGGTPACAWMSRENILTGGGKAWIDEYEEGLKTLDPAAYEEQFRQTPAARKTDPFEDPFSDMLMKGMGFPEIFETLTGQKPDPAMLPQILAAASSPVVGPKTETRPSGLYESMLKEVAPYTLKSFLYYQGESDGDRHPELYKTLFPALIHGFRELWGEELPFLFVQIAPFGSWMQSVGEPYTAIRKAQQYASETVPGTGMAVITDIDMELDIHPKKKQPVGRLALQAMNKVYGETDVLAEAPTLIGAEMKNEELVLHFENAGSGLRLADQTPDGAYADAARLGGLAITLGGTPLDLTDIPAVAEGSTVMLTSPLFMEGVEAEICLASTGWYRVNLYNSADLPARPAKVHIAP